MKKVQSCVRCFCRYWFVYKNTENFSTNSRNFPGVQGNYLVFKGPGRKFQNSRSFSGIPGVVGTMLQVTKMVVHKGKIITCKELFFRGQCFNEWASGKNQVITASMGSGCIGHCILSI